MALPPYCIAPQTSPPGTGYSWLLTLAHTELNYYPEIFVTNMDGTLAWKGYPVWAKYFSQLCLARMHAHSCLLSRSPAQRSSALLMPTVCFSCRSYPDLRDSLVNRVGKAINRLVRSSPPHTHTQTQTNKHTHKHSHSPTYIQTHTSRFSICARCACKPRSASLTDGLSLLGTRSRSLLAMPAGRSTQDTRGPAQPVLADAPRGAWRRWPLWDAAWQPLGEPAVGGGQALSLPR